MADERCILDPNRDCLGLIEARRLEGDLKALSERNGADHKEFREQIREIREMEIQQAAQFSAILETMREIKDGNKEMLAALNALKPKAEAVDKMEEDMEAMENRIDEIEKKPAKKWEGISDKFIGGIIGVLAAAVGGAILWLIKVAGS